MLAIIGVGSVLFRINLAANARLGPLHRFTASGGDTFLTEEHAIAIARDVMNRDGFPESAWRMMEDDRSKAPDGRPDRYVVRNDDNPNRGMIYFHCDSSPTPQRFVHVEFRGDQIEAQGELGK